MRKFAFAQAQSCLWIKWFYVMRTFALVGIICAGGEMSEDEIKLRLFLAGYFKHCLKISKQDHMSDLAKAAGVAQSTLNRFVKEPLISPLPHTRTLLKVSVYTSVPIFSGFEPVPWVSISDGEDAKPLPDPARPQPC